MEDASFQDFLHKITSGLSLDHEDEVKIHEIAVVRLGERHRRHELRVPDEHECPQTLETNRHCLR